MTPRYYAIRINAHEPHDSPESARKEAESLPMDEGDEWGILELVGITRRSVTTTWLDQQAKDPSPPNPLSQWSWPTLPPGRSYLNPENLTVEQLGDGWRPLCTLDERFPEDHQLKLGRHWSTASASTAKPSVHNVAHTYRTRAPIPTLPSNP